MEQELVSSELVQRGACQWAEISSVPKLCSCSTHQPLLEKMSRCSALLPECHRCRVTFAAGNAWMIYRKICAHPNDFQEHFDYNKNQYASRLFPGNPCTGKDKIYWMNN